MKRVASLALGRALTLALGLATAMVACQSDSKEYKYQFEDNGCNTGEQKFTSVQDMCAGLQSRSLNNGCALGLRQLFFSQNCAGTFTETN